MAFPLKKGHSGLVEWMTLMLVTVVLKRIESLIKDVLRGLTEIGGKGGRHLWIIPLRIGLFSQLMVPVSDFHKA